MSDADEKFAPDFDEQEMDLTEEMPLLPIRNAVLFPGAVAPFDVGREKSVVGSRHRDQSHPSSDLRAARRTGDTGQDELYRGVAARVLKALCTARATTLILQDSCAGAWSSHKYARTSRVRVALDEAKRRVEAEAYGDEPARPRPAVSQIAGADARSRLADRIDQGAGSCRSLVAPTGHAVDEKASSRDTRRKESTARSSSAHTRSSR